MTKSPRSPADTETISIEGVSLTHRDIFTVVDDFYTRIQLDPVLQIPFRSVGDWPEHIERLTHFWWIRFGGAPYLLSHYSPIPKHFFAGFNRELLERWLDIFQNTLRTHLRENQIELWTTASRRLGEALFIKNDLFKKAYEDRRSEIPRNDLKSKSRTVK